MRALIPALLAVCREPLVLCVGKEMSYADPARPAEAPKGNRPPPVAPGNARLAERLAPPVRDGTAVTAWGGSAAAGAGLAPPAAESLAAARSPSPPPARKADPALRLPTPPRSLSAPLRAAAVPPHRGLGGRRSHGMGQHPARCRSAHGPAPLWRANRIRSLDRTGPGEVAVGRKSYGAGDPSGCAATITARRSRLWTGYWEWD